MGLLKQRSGPFHRIGNRYETFFGSDHFMGRSAFEDSWMVKPSANVKQREDAIIIEIAIPGFTREEVTVEVKNDALYVWAKKSNIDETEKYFKREVPTHVFTKVVELKPNIDQSKISATLDNGILKLMIPQELNGKKVKAIKVS